MSQKMFFWIKKILICAYFCCINAAKKYISGIYLGNDENKCT
jgi:hypothetical protein